MARTESDREDLFAEATALVRRAELAGRGDAGPVVVGVRRDGGSSVYFCGDPAYHFDSQSRLKRAFVAGRLYRTQGETLAELTRERSAEATVLHRRDLPPDELAAFVGRMLDRLGGLVKRLESGETIIRQVPEGEDEIRREFTAAVARAIAAGSLAPRFKGKR